MKTVVEKLREHSEPDTSNWREVFKEMNANDIWLKHSQHIALIKLDKMDELKMTQKQLAERMSCSHQYVSKVLKGQENLSLETLAKIERALGISIFKEEPLAV